MKRRVNYERILLFLILIALLLGVVVDCLHAQRIKKLEKAIEDIGIPIEQKDGFFIEESIIPQELLEKEVIIDD